MGQFPHSHDKICKYLWPLTLYYVVRSACTQSLLLLASIIIQIVVTGPREIFLNWVAKLERTYFQNIVGVSVCFECSCE